MAGARPTVDAGVAFPSHDGRRSTTRTGRAVLADAAREVDGALADRIAGERDWRKRYPVHVRALVEAELAAPDASGVARTGLASLHDRFVFARDGGEVPLHRADEVEPTRVLHTVEVAGQHPREDELVVPYRGQHLHGDALHRQLDAWVEAGTLEPSFAEAVRQVMTTPEWRDLSDETFVVLGAGAEMGPLTTLCGWGATVVPVDLPRSGAWEAILRTVREGCGRAVVPVARQLGPDADHGQIAAVAGADLITELPEVARWLEDEIDGPVTVGNYVYADGGDNVRVSMAADALTVRLAEADPGVSIAVLATPTDVYAAPEEAVLDAQRRFDDTSAARRLLRTATGSRVFAPNYPNLVTTDDGARFGIADCLISQQGSNYALAKRLHRWRAREARAQGHVVSANVAPATSTRSVTKNRVLAAAYAGAPHFDVEVFEPATSNTLMAAMLVHDLRNPKASGNPDAALRHPLELFASAAGHGGMWRQAYAPRSVLPLAAMLGMASRR